MKQETGSAPAPQGEGFPLRAFNGEAPPAPDWFSQALAQAPQRGVMECAGVPIETLAWGESGRPGLLFLHGDSAHADWWSFIAPAFARDWRCVALSWSGMGGSGHRPSGYSMQCFVDEILAVLASSDINRSGAGVTVVAHSMGSVPAMLASHRTNCIRAIVAVDTIILTPERYAELPGPRAPAPHRVYPSLAAALSGFRLLPPQAAVNHFIIDFVARKGLREIKLDNGDSGWVWRVDPNLWRGFSHTVPLSLPGTTLCKLAFIWGEHSVIADAAQQKLMRRILPQDCPMIAIPQAAHHILIDQPLALISALRALLAVWPSAPPHFQDS